MNKKDQMTNGLNTFRKYQTDKNSNTVSLPVDLVDDILDYLTNSEKQTMDSPEPTKENNAKKCDNKIGATGSLYFVNSLGTERLLKCPCTEQEVPKIIADFLDQHHYKSYYTRIIFHDGFYCYDVGSHSEFFKFYINKKENNKKKVGHNSEI